MTNYRNGDILISETTLPKDAINTGEVSQIVLAEGEITGHKHLLRGTKIQTWKDIVGNIYVEVKEKPAQLTHEEHNTITIDIGKIYIIKHEQEYDYFGQEIKKVLD
jgi:hypothetical protein